MLLELKWATMQSQNSLPKLYPREVRLQPIHLGKPLIPGDNQNLGVAREVRTLAEESTSGATSADVNKGIGQPVYGRQVMN